MAGIKKTKNAKHLRKGKSLEAQKPLKTSSAPSISEIVVTKPIDISSTKL